MNRIRITELSGQHFACVNIHSISATLYQVEVQTAAAASPARVCDERMIPATFPHLEAIRECFTSVSVDAFFLLHTSPYDEMIGLPSATPNTLKTQLAWQS